MMQRWRLAGFIGLLVFSLIGTFITVGAADAPDFTKFGYPTVGASMDVNPDQAVTLTAGNQAVAIKAGTFDGPVTFDLLTNTPSAWQSQVSGRTVRAAFAFRVTDKATKAILGTFKQPVTYTYSGPDAQSTDAILNTSAASPPVITPNPAPITFDGKVNHTFGGAGVGWLVVSAPTGGTSSAAAGTSTSGTASAGSGATPAANAAAATRPVTSAVATGTGGASVLPTTGISAGGAAFPWFLLVIVVGGITLTVGVTLRKRALSR